MSVSKGLPPKSASSTVPWGLLMFDTETPPLLAYRLWNYSPDSDGEYNTQGLRNGKNLPRELGLGWVGSFCTVQSCLTQIKVSATKPDDLSSKVMMEGEK